MSTKPATSTKVDDVPACKEPACTVAKDGRCYEGIPDPKACVNYSFSASTKESDSDDLEDEEESEEGEEANVDSLPATIDLYGGMELQYESSLRITLNSLARVVVLAGPNDSGKTTLLTSIYEHFLVEPLSGYIFAGSETLRAFEKRCHLSRIESKRESEDTERTKSFSEQTMLHLCVRDQKLEKSAQHLLLSDIRGELFVQAMKSKADCQRIKILKRADHVCIVIDGARLADLATRNQATVAAKQTLRSFLESEMIGNDTFIDVLFTKDDIIRSTEATLNTNDFIKEFEADLNAKFGSQVRRIRFLRIAARPAEGLESYGVADLFKCWVEDCSFERSDVEPFVREISSEREFDRFAAIHLPQKFLEGEK